MHEVEWFILILKTNGNGESGLWEMKCGIGLFAMVVLGNILEGLKCSWAAHCLHPRIKKMDQQLRHV